MLTSIQSGMGIGESPSQGRLFPDPQVTQSTTLIDTEAVRGLERRRKEIEGGQLAMTEDYAPEELDRAQQQEDRMKEMRDGDVATSSERYTKDLEEMLGQIVTAFTKLDSGIYIGPTVSQEAVDAEHLLTEAKALLERTHADFADF